MQSRVNVVDLFSGCGGLSLGFELSTQPQEFRTVMALDNSKPAIRCFNQNHRALRPELGRDVGRVADLTWFNCESEILLFYLDHYADVAEDVALREAIDGELGFGEFLATVNRLDSEYLAALKESRLTEEFKTSAASVAKGVGALAIVKRFFRRLEIPAGWGRAVSLPELLWQRPVSPTDQESQSQVRVSSEIQGALKELWDVELGHLRNATVSKGRGQHAAVAGKVASAIDFLDGPSGRQLFEIWFKWRCARDSAREEYFDCERLQGQIASLYVGPRRVQVLLGGPPCKGISRIGRAKIQSLREQGVHGWIHREYVDDRNLLFLKYVAFLEALTPDVFVFENVRHFTSALKNGESGFDAAAALAEAIDQVSSDEHHYETSSAILKASEYGCPQVRERFFYVGTRNNRDDSEACRPLAVQQLLAIQEEPQKVPLLAAILGLGDPGRFEFGERESANLGYRVIGYDCTLRHLGHAAERYAEWIRRPLPGSRGIARDDVDGHVFRAVRDDDAALVSLFGPGKRWMDYTVDSGRTLAGLRSVLSGIGAYVDGEVSGDLASSDFASAARELEKALKGKSVVLRLLMEELGTPELSLFGTGGPHHLLKSTYLSKGPDNHGDWFERLDPSRPCKTIVSHMARDTYSFFHPWEPRPLTVREAARIQTFPDWFEFGMLGMCDAYEIVGNAVPPLLSSKIAANVSTWLSSQVLAATG